MIAAIDSGNTLTKIGVFRKGKLEKILKISSYTEIIKSINHLKPEKILICSVKYSYDDFEKDLPNFQLFTLTNTTPVPFTIKYTTPDTLGVDRLALVAGACEKYRDTNLLIIGTGTCITYDFIDAGGNYLGGGISPGIDIRLKSLHDFTENLPFVRFQPDADLIGQSTESSILSGVINGIKAEVRGISEEYRLNFSDLTVVLSGGNVKFFESTLKDSIFAIPNLVLWGLYSIFLYNER